MAQLDLSTIRVFLFDLDGTLYVGDRLIDGAVELLTHVKRSGRLCRFVTNTTTRSLDSLFRKLKDFGLPVKKEELFCPARAAQLFLRQQKSSRLFLVVEPETACDFAEFEQVSENPDFVVIGNYSNRWTYDLLNRMFKMIMAGAEILALHRGRYWQVEDGLRLDIGAFVTGLEYASGKKAHVMGKPSESFYQMALDDLGLEPEQVVMVGDDIASDIGGSQAVGMRGILVKTGKYRHDLIERSSVQPDMVIDSIASLMSIMSR
ncbi:MAG: TIGR01458 family HAD-type hydrolase [Candidatus Zixiibacteriota bacterium]